MIRSTVRAVTLGAAALGAMCVAQAASATTFTFTNKGSTSDAGVSSKLFYSDDGSMSVKATAWHANDPNTSKVTSDPIVNASLGYWQNAGMGVLFGNDNSADGTHQIDNVGKNGVSDGVDFVMLQFSKDVTLNSIGRNAYTLTGVKNQGIDAAYWADTGDMFGSPSSSSTIDLTKYSADESLFKSIGGNGSLGTSASASVWLVSAAFNQANDGFKISGLTVGTSSGGNTPPPGAVPEPASWAMMIVGFGAIGTGMRRRKAATPATA